MYPQLQPSSCLRPFVNAERLRTGLTLPDPEHAALDGGLQQLSRIRHPHFLHHVGAVRFNGFDADLQPLTDFLVLKSGPDQFQNFLFA